jgi:hypothetical protein
MHLHSAASSGLSAMDVDGRRRLAELTADDVIAEGIGWGLPRVRAVRAVRAVLDGVQDALASVDPAAHPGVPDVAWSTVEGRTATLAARRGSSAESRSCQLSHEGAPTTRSISGRIRSMSEPTQKYSITMPRDIAEAARSRSGPSGLSAYVAAAVRRQIERDNLNELISVAEAEHGTITDQEVEATRDALRRAREQQGTADSDVA